MKHTITISKYFRLEKYRVPYHSWQWKDHHADRVVLPAVLKQNIQQRVLNFIYSIVGHLGPYNPNTTNHWFIIIKEMHFYFYISVKLTIAKQNKKCKQEMKPALTFTEVNSCIILTESFTAMRQRYSTLFKHNQQCKHGSKVRSSFSECDGNVCQSCQHHTSCECS